MVGEVILQQDQSYLKQTPIKLANSAQLECFYS